MASIQELGNYELYRSLTRSEALISLCEREEVNLRGSAVFYSNPQRFALIVDIGEGFATLVDDCDKSIRFFASVADAHQYIAEC
jgi:hypothetical protein